MIGLSWLKSRASRDLRNPCYLDRPSPDGINDWLFVTPKESKGWILDAICREIGSRLPGSWEVVYNPKTLPVARTYFFSHYWNYLDHLKRNPHIREGRTLVWYTHPREIPYSLEEQLEAYNNATQMIFTCTAFLHDWFAKGLRPDRGQVILGGADPTLFRGHERGNGVVGLSSSYYERKNPDTLLHLVRALPHRRFRLLGRKWENYPQIEALLDLPNFEYLSADYSSYPNIYSTFDVFVSLAVLEGGPIPLLEAMMENAVPVASRTGFAPDLIHHGDNGYLFDVGSSATEIAELIERASTNRSAIRPTVLRYRWDNFASAVGAIGNG